MPPIITMQEVSKNYILRSWKSWFNRQPKVVNALSDVSLEVNEGEIVGLLGPNGAGKTTILKILSTLVTPDSGKVIVDGFNANHQSLNIRKQIGLVTTNDRSFYWRLSGWENLQFYGHLSNLYGKKLSNEISRVTAQVGMEDRINQQYGTYSSGERQRLGIARAMLGNPKILFMDEATANLDPLVSRELLKFTSETLVQQLNKTIIWCTHNLHEAEQVCDRVVILNKGKLVATKTVAELQSLHNPPAYSLVISQIPSFIRKIDGFSEKQHPIHKSCKIHCPDNKISMVLHDLLRENITVYELKKDTKRLEDAFITLVQQQ